MRIHLLSVGRRMPAWVEQGFGEYAKRLPQDCHLRLVEIDPVPRTKGGDAARAIAVEGERLLQAVPKGARVIALDVEGRPWSTEALAAELERWLASGQDLALLVGGADGLSSDCLVRADARWSLSPLTFPHPLVRVILAEQLYRAWTLTQGHPYHRS
ncbi:MULTISPECIES: 23S rRNA (pseudouridine(1915)-N(3))-methyltransferase RlmH [Thiorhodovibrio]|uniref:23S rRNA (pseudouridine(1915)-N(3))-methyltransferase RlmH n=1 Tax=Thiorhodovibrio TaxID=61593 RepID=UPI001912B381|nr:MULTISPECIES: 23S rRNA (pseudouridine(1915)-N(3))-methyltransferase RlmH [Thiorhodovibrio]MBK5969893.1 23S rRNA (pseudouridine(1915)-N(3))-methyltransferase RlmH [Thiorhodovibrio winogradskyi]WPL12062.1 Ribosomal RNA large subunit methyltransferase H [Thiorhodovibrio litoralis]